MWPERFGERGRRLGALLKAGERENQRVLPYWVWPRQAGNQSSHAFQSPGGKSMCQKRGAGEENSIATSFLDSIFLPRRTTRTCVLSLPTPFSRVRISPARTFIASIRSAPCAFTTRVWVSSEKVPSDSSRRITFTRIRATTRWLRLASV